MGVGEEIIHVIMVWMDGEISNFIKVWLTIFISLSYCYLVGRVVPLGTTRLLLFLPVVCLFLNLPLHLHSMHLGGMTAFFIAWLANFKLLMFAFAIGPLSDPSLSLLKFVALASLPIKIQQVPSQIKPDPSTNWHSKQNPSPKSPQNGHKSLLNYAIKILLVAVFVKFYDYSDRIHPMVLLFVYCLHIYCGLEVIMAMVAALARNLLRLELEPQFNEPYLSTSLQDFWGRRWNLMVTRILRPTVYEPVLKISTRMMGRKWAAIPAVFGTFVVSAIIHELIFFYLGRVKPTFEITCFFLLHGLCLVVEIVIKKAVNGRWRLPQLVSGLLSLSLVLITGFWLFLPVLIRLRGVDRVLAEYEAVGAFVKDLSRAMVPKPNNVTHA